MWKDENLKRFLETGYEEAPVVLPPESMQAPIFSIRDGCLALKIMIEAKSIQWWINGRRRQEMNIPLHILDGGDETAMNHFIDEVTRLNDGEEMMFSGHNCHAAIPELQLRCKPFLHQLYGESGVCSNGVNLMMFGGKYTETPAGVHTDPCDIFLIPLIGGKRLLTWEWQLLDGNEGTEVPVKIPAKSLTINWREEQHKAEVYCCNAGDILYFPVGYWHINDYQTAKNTFSFGINVFKNSDFARTIGAIQRKMHQLPIADKIASMSAKCDESGEVLELDPTYAQYLALIEEAIRINFLIRSSSAGFVTGIKLDTTVMAFSLNCPVRVRPYSRIFLVNCEDGRDTLISNGMVAKLNLSADAKIIISTLIETGKCDPTFFAQSGADPCLENVMNWLLQTGSVIQDSEIENAYV